MIIRSATPADAEQIGRIFFQTVRTVNLRDYSQAQVEAWAPEPSGSPERWVHRQHDRSTAVADEGGTILGFGELEPNGHIDCFYVHHEHQRRGVGRKLLEAIEAEARRQGQLRLFVEASITARPFFETQGFTTLREQQVTCRGQQFTNFAMQKLLDNPKQPSGSAAPVLERVDSDGSV